ncbi:MAG: hypothetical protein IJU57_04705 [Clostridia bacterium]|nr:hypothetical protein [Clostridia bacterium]
MALQTLRLGTAYHGNRMLHHAREDLRDIMNNGMDIVVHMLSHTDWDRHLQRIKDMVELSSEIGLESWIDNWGLGGPPGDKSFFLAYHPEAHQVMSDGKTDPVRACLNADSFRAFTREWIDAVAYIGGRTIFWDEPHIPVKPDGTYSCACPVCRKKFSEMYGYEMPGKINEDVKKFRMETLRSYFTEVTDYSASKGIRNTVCVAPDPVTGFDPAPLSSICGAENLQNIGSDPYWIGYKDVDPYGFVYENTKKSLELSEHFGKDHNIWIQAYGIPLGREDEIIEACEAAYDAGARTILAWGYYGSESNDYAARNPEKTWNRVCEGFRRIRELEHDRILSEKRALYRK